MVGNRVEWWGMVGNGEELLGMVGNGVDVCHECFQGINTGTEYQGCCAHPEMKKLTR